MAYIFSSIALLVSVGSFLYLRFYVKRRTSVDRIPEQTREAVEQIVNEIDRITDRDSLLIEERAAKLKALLAETDKRLRVLMREQDALMRNAPLIPEAPTVAAAAPTVAAAAPTVAAVDAAAPAVDASPPVEAGGADGGKEAADVAALARQGMPPALIAARMGKSITEVEMALFLAGHSGENPPQRP